MEWDLIAQCCHFSLPKEEMDIGVGGIAAPLPTVNDLMKEPALPVAPSTSPCACACHDPRLRLASPAP